MLFGSAVKVSLASDWATDPQARWSGILALIGVMNAAIAAAYYLRIIGVMYFRDPVGRPAAEGGRGAAGAMLLAAVLIVGIGCFPGVVRTEASRASESARTSIGRDYLPTIFPGLTFPAGAATAPAGEAAELAGK